MPHVAFAAIGIIGAHRVLALVATGEGNILIALVYRLVIDRSAGHSGRQLAPRPALLAGRSWDTYAGHCQNIPSGYERSRIAPLLPAPEIAAARTYSCLEQPV